MPRRYLLPCLLPFLALTACTDREPPTAPSGSERPALAVAAGLRVVNSVADPGDGICNAAQCTLREAINDPQSTDITFAPGLTDTIKLARPGVGGGSLVIDKPLTITGPSSKIVIRRPSTAPPFRIFFIGSHATVTLSNLIIRRGQTDQQGGGGGIINYGSLTLIKSSVEANSALFGGGISNRTATLDLRNSRIAGNSSGGIYIELGKLSVTNSAVRDNTGAGIDMHHSTATLADARILGNSNGGISARFGNLTLSRSTVAGNSGGGGIANVSDTLTLDKSTVADNSAAREGGGIFNWALARTASTVALVNSTVSGNSAPIGGGISQSGGTVTLTNSTVARNTASRQGGGISLRAGQGGSDAVVFLINSLVAKNASPTAPDIINDVCCSLVSVHFSVVGDSTGAFIPEPEASLVGNAAKPIDPKIGPLANNGGPTETHALLAGSPAIDAGSSQDCPATDQRGVSRPQGAGCDIGSYERRQ